MKSRGKILVIRGGAIGDFILTLPVLAALRESFPETHLEILGYAHVARLAVASRLADGIQSIEARALAPFFAHGAALPEAMADYFGEFALIISYLYDPDDFFKINVARCSAAQFIQGPHRPNTQEKLHATEVFLKPLERLAIYSTENVPKISLTSDSGTKLTAGRWMAAHPGSGSESKNWPQGLWRQLLGRVTEETDWKLLLTGGEADGNRIEELAAAIPSNRSHIAKSIPLTDLAGLLGQCSFFLGHDSGITHLAAAVGLRGLALWGESDEQIWRPGPSIRVLREPGGLGQLTVEKVWNELNGLIQPS